MSLIHAEFTTSSHMGALALNKGQLTQPISKPLTCSVKLELSPLLRNSYAFLLCIRFVSASCATASLSAPLAALANTNPSCHTVMPAMTADQSAPGKVSLLSARLACCDNSTVLGPAHRSVPPHVAAQSLAQAACAVRAERLPLSAVTPAVSARPRRPAGAWQLPCSYGWLSARTAPDSGQRRLHSALLK